jgi:putative inorganic carbon (HCO3(-)) transporter
LAVGAVALCVQLTQSRTGILVLLAVLGVYLIRRYRTLGVIAAIALTVVLPMIGGRADGTDADQSTMERYEAWRTAMDLIRSYPVFGVGFDRFQEYHLLTAHNSYLLVPAELGLPGMVMWLAILCISLITPISVLRQLPKQGHTDVLPARTWGLALIASFAGLVVGMLFFSLAYHELIWIYVGLSAAYYRAVVASFPEISVRLRLGGVVAISALAVALLVFFSFLLKWKGY